MRDIASGRHPQHSCPHSPNRNPMSLGGSALGNSTRACQLRNVKELQGKVTELEAELKVTSREARYAQTRTAYEGLAQEQQQ
eukprot:6592310-Alexandrium_andersonii.AAC.1